MGMNPGPFGMTQTGVPFGEIEAVKSWMGIEAPIQPPASEHPKRRIEGFGCRRSEVSGRRVWGWAAARFGTAEAFFKEAFMVNYCPLVFLEHSGRNRTPDAIPAAEMAPVYAACDAHLDTILDALDPAWVVGIGHFAQKKLARAVNRLGRASRTEVGTILHPSPASPQANRGWAEAIEAQLAKLGCFAKSPGWFSEPEVLPPAERGVAGC